MVDVVKNGSGVRTDGAGLILNPRYLQPYPFEVYDAAGWYGWMERRWTWGKFFFFFWGGRGGVKIPRCEPNKVMRHNFILLTCRNT